MLRAAAASVLSDPSGAVHELILSDDYSTDPGTLQALAELAAADPRVAVHRAPRNGGPARARNLARATVDWVAFIDADDLWLPGHVTQAQVVLAAIPSAEWIVAAHEVLGPDGARTRPPALSDAHPVAPVALGVLRYAAPASTQALIGNWLFFLCLSTLADLYFLPAPGYVLRRQHASLTTSSRRLTQHRVSGKRAALAPHRQQLRWALRSTYKGLAADNVLAWHHARGAQFALRAFAMDPREVHEAVRFLRLLLARDRIRAQALAPAYSAAELLPGA